MLIIYTKVGDDRQHVYRRTDRIAHEYSGDMMRDTPVDAPVRDIRETHHVQAAQRPSRALIKQLQAGHVIS